MKMEQKISRLKIVLAKKKRTNRWLAVQLGKNEVTISNTEL
jgi:putative transcriptional regulator